MKRLFLFDPEGNGVELRQYEDTRCAASQPILSVEKKGVLGREVLLVGCDPPCTLSCRVNPSTKAQVPLPLMSFSGHAVPSAGASLRSMEGRAAGWGSERSSISGQQMEDRQHRSDAASLLTCTCAHAACTALKQRFCPDLTGI